MKKSQDFWQRIKKPIYALAPMAGVTDSAFRQICKEFGADVVYSEMASATALVYNPKRTLEILEFNKRERPYVVQLFGSNPDHFAVAARLVEKKIKPDGIDINFGCPVKKVQKQGAGAILMNNLNLSKKIITAVANNTTLPVSVKCRSYVGDVSVLDFLKKIKGLGVKALMIHGRAAAQGHSGEVDWKIIKEARNYFQGIILANGGAMSAEDGHDLLKKTGADGIGIARGALGRPWIFSQFKNKKLKIDKEKIFKIALRHVHLAHKLKGKEGIIEMRKHLCWYVAGLPDASQLKKKLVLVDSITDVIAALK